MAQVKSTVYSCRSPGFGFHTHMVTPNSRGSDAPFWLLEALGTQVHKHASKTSIHVK